LTPAPSGARFYLFNGVFPDDNPSTYPGITDIYVKLGIKPLARVAVGLDIHYFQSDEDVTWTDASGNKHSDDDVGWETDLAVKYKYSKNLCLTLGWEHFDPDNAYVGSGDDDPEDHLWFQADLKF
jgi:hypothetical protein